MWQADLYSSAVQHQEKNYNNKIIWQSSPKEGEETHLSRKILQ